ncbi:MAG: LysR family transcriptional regulator [Burkholderiales bacterium]|nr:LysR family transcriptional regulator [Burkholderiales bacterium]
MAFTHVADSGSFTRAAERLGWPKSSVSHRVARLEECLGARLLERSTRRLRLTDVGARFHEHTRRVLQELDMAAATVASFRARPQGRLRVSASVVLGQSLLPAMLAEYAAAYPEVELFVDLANRRVDLLEEGIDLAIRAGELPDSSLVSRRLGSATARLYAAPAYLRRHCTPLEPDELDGHILIDNAPAAATPCWNLTHDDGRTQSILTRFVLAANDAALLRELAATGAGIVTLPAFVAAPAVATGQLVPILQGWATRRVDVQAVFPSHKSLSPALRAFVDLAVVRLGAALDGS